MKQIATSPTVGCRGNSAGYSRQWGSAIFAWQPGWLFSRLNWQQAISHNAAVLRQPMELYPAPSYKTGPLKLKHSRTKTGFLLLSDTSYSPPKPNSQCL